MLFNLSFLTHSSLHGKTYGSSLCSFSNSSLFFLNSPQITVFLFVLHLQYQKIFSSHLYSLHSDSPWHFSLHKCSHFNNCLWQIILQTYFLSYSSSWMWHFSWQKCTPQGNMQSHILLQINTLVSPHLIFLNVSFPHLHFFSTRTSHGGQGPSWQVNGQGCPHFLCIEHGYGHSNFVPHKNGAFFVVFPHVHFISPSCTI